MTYITALALSRGSHYFSFFLLVSSGGRILLLYFWPSSVHYVNHGRKERLRLLQAELKLKFRNTQSYTVATDDDGKIDAHQR